MYCYIKSPPDQTSDVSESHAHVLQDTSHERESTAEDKRLRPRLDTCLSTWIVTCSPWPARTPSQVDKSTREAGIKAGGKVKRRKLFHQNSSIFTPTGSSRFQPHHDQKKEDHEKQKACQFQRNPSRTKFLLEPGTETYRKNMARNRQTDSTDYTESGRSSQGPLLLSRLFFHLINTH